MFWCRGIGLMLGLEGLGLGPLEMWADMGIGFVLE